MHKFLIEFGSLGKEISAPEIMSYTPSENLIPLSEVPRRLPRRRGNRIHISTIYRWCKVGIRGRKLEYVEVGGLLYTTELALAEFMKPSMPRDEVKIVDKIIPGKNGRSNSLEQRGF